MYNKKGYYAVRQRGFRSGIILEVKGFWSTDDRRKHAEIKKQHGDLDIRLVFENSRRKIRKGSKTTYGDWCKKKNIVYCDRVVPQNWLREKLIVMPQQTIEIKGKLSYDYTA